MNVLSEQNLFICRGLTVLLLISDRVDFRAREITRVNKKRHTDTGIFKKIQESLCT